MGSVAVASLLPLDGAVEVSLELDGAVDESVLAAGVGAAAGSVAGFCMSCGDADGVLVGSELVVDGVVVDGAVVLSLLVCAETKPTVPTIVAAVIAAVRILEAFMVELLGCGGPVSARCE